MADSPFHVTAMAQLSRAQLRDAADITIEPPKYGYMRLHISLSELPANAATLTIDIAPTKWEVGRVQLRG